MDDPKVWFQLGIAEHRAVIVERDVATILKTFANVGVKLQMIQERQGYNENEKMYGAFLVAKSEIQRKLLDATPSFGRSMMMNILGDRKV